MTDHVRVSPWAIQLVGTSLAYGDVERDTDAVVQMSEHGVQILSIIHSASAPDIQRYELEVSEGITVVADDEGGFLFQKQDGDVVGNIEAPWAKDASGNYLPTNYELEGAVLVQRIDLSEATYPVVADPKITYGLGVYLNLWGHELGAAATTAAAVLGIGAAVACTAIEKLPYWILRSIASLACAAGVLSLPDLFKALVSAYNNTTIDAFACYQKKILGVGAASDQFKIVGASNCT